MFPTTSSAATAMAWNWVIQSVAKFKQVDSPTLAGLVDKAPAISIDLGKDAKEMVSLRILESLFLHGNEATVNSDSAQNVKVSFDPSEHCEDVLHKVLEETSEPITGLDRQKWNIHPFIIQKRASLPKTPVQKFKEALLEGGHPIESLKEMSKLGGTKVSENTVPDVDIGCNAQTTLTKDDLVFLKAENKNSKLQESPLQKSYLVKDSNKGITGDIGRKEHEMTIKPPVKDLEENTLMDIESLKEMSKLGGTKVSENTVPDVDIGCNAQTTLTKDDLVFLKAENKNSKLQESPLQKSYLVKDSNKGITGDIGRKEHEMTIKPPVKDLEENTLMDHVERVVSGTPEQSCDHDNIDHSQQQPPGEDDDDDEMTDIAAKKEALLSSQCTLNQDFMSTVEFAEIFLCMKCSKGGQLLVCSSDACQFRVHESCLGSASTFNGNEMFFCPFCSYSHAISKYMEVKKKASLARKDLQAFLCSGVKRGTKISSKTGACLDEKVSTQIGATGEKFKLNNNEHAMSRGKDCTLANSQHQSIHQGGLAKQPTEEKESPMSSTSNHSKRARKQEPQYISTITLPRRSTLFWEKTEEEMLKEGMLRFASEENKKVPWKKILEYGRDVFNKSRTAVDLKDKWRNMCKENPAIKKQKL